MNLEQLLNAPEESLAIGVLRQAVHDLRRFRNATGGLERELYRDAYRWITSDDASWPYSFPTICKLLDVLPEMLRAELLADASLGWFSYWRKAGASAGRYCRTAFARVFSGSPNGYRAPIAPQLTHS